MIDILATRATRIYTAAACTRGFALLSRRDLYDTRELHLPRKRGECITVGRVRQKGG